MSSGLFPHFIKLVFFWIYMKLLVLERVPKMLFGRCIPHLAPKGYDMGDLYQMREGGKGAVRQRAGRNLCHKFLEKGLVCDVT